MNFLNELNRGIDRIGLEEREVAAPFDKKWIKSDHRVILLRDNDASNVVCKGWVQLNTLAHYRLADGAVLRIVPANQRRLALKKCDGTLRSSNGMFNSPLLGKNEDCKEYHMVSPNSDLQISNRHKVVSEVYLTRLLATKCTIQQYIDDLFDNLLSVEKKCCPSVKWLFDFFNKVASTHNIVDQNVAYAWKCNSLMFRFWVNIIKNPDFVFDIKKPLIVDSCLSVVSQVLMDSCSLQDHRLSKDSPSSKLLFAKDIPRYRNLVSNYYDHITNLPQISDEELYNLLTQYSITHPCEVPNDEALQTLYSYAVQYRVELLESLDDDCIARRLNMASQFEGIQAMLDRDRNF